jgi:hypothetical protein
MTDCHDLEYSSLRIPILFQIKTFPSLSQWLGVGETFLFFGVVAFLCVLWGVSQFFTYYSDYTLPSIPLFYSTQICTVIYFFIFMTAFLLHHTCQLKQLFPKFVEENCVKKCGIFPFNS